MSGQPSSFFHRLLARVFPSMPDFYGLLATQSTHASHTVGLLVTLMETSDDAIGAEIKREEHNADRAKKEGLRILNESFATPVDREDIRRAIVHLDEVVNYCKTTVYEMEGFAIGPDEYLLEMAKLLKEGVDALAQGFGKLGKSPKMATDDARIARKAERNVEKTYRRALAELFQGTNYNDMFKRREVYRHMSNAADRLANCADALSDIVVKIT